MRTLVIGDMHLGCGTLTNIFSRTRALEEMLDAVAAVPTRVVLNGDTFDFLAHGALRGTEAEQVMHMFTEDATSGAVLAALGRVHTRGGELLFRTGEHDLALGDRAVQAVLVRALTKARGTTSRIGFAAGGRPTRLVVGGVGVVVTHDVTGADSAANRWIATHILNPIRREYGVGFADLLRPNYAEAAVAALAVNPTAARLVLRDADDEGRPALLDVDAALRLPRVFERSGLTSRERQAFSRALDPAHAAGLDLEDYASLELARIKLLRHVLTPRRESVDRLRPLDGREWAAARRLAARFQARVVVSGHSRAVGWRCDEALTAVDVGTWAWLLVAPQGRAGRQTLETWQRTSRIDASAAEASLFRRWTAVLLDPHGDCDRARLSILEWHPDGRSTCLREQWLTASS